MAVFTYIDNGNGPSCPPSLECRVGDEVIIVFYDPAATLDDTGVIVGTIVGGPIPSVQGYLFQISYDENLLDNPSLNLNNNAILRYVCCLGCQGEFARAIAGGATPFVLNLTLEGNIGSQSIVNNDTIRVLGGGLLTSQVTPTDTATIFLIPGNNGDLIQTIAGTPTWVPATTIVTASQTPITVVDTATVDLTSSGLAGHNLQADVRISAALGNTISVNPDGLYAAGGGGGGSMNSFNIIGSAGPAQTVTDANTVLIAGANLISTVSSAVDTVTISLTAGANGDIIQTVAGVPVWVSPSGVVSANQTPITVVDTQSVDLTSSGISGHTIQADVRISAALGNIITLNPDGLFATGGGGGPGMNSFNVAGNTGTPQTITDSNTLSILGAGLLTTNASATDTVTASLVAGANGDIIQTVAGVPTWIAASTIVTGSQTPISVIDTPSVNLTASGVSNHTLQADVNISAAPGNTITLLPDGLFSTGGGGGTMSSFIVAGQSGVPQTITDGNTLSILPVDASIVTAASATDIVRVGVQRSTLAGNLITLQPDGLHVANVTQPLIEQRITANYNVLPTDDVIVVDVPGAADVVVTLPDTGLLTVFNPLGPSTANVKQFKVIKRSGAGAVRVNAFPGNVFVNETGIIRANGAEATFIPRSNNPVVQEQDWEIRRLTYSKQQVQTITNLTNPSPGVLLNYTITEAMLAQFNTFVFNYAPGTEPSEISIFMPPPRYTDEFVYFAFLDNMSNNRVLINSVAQFDFQPAVENIYGPFPKIIGYRGTFSPSSWSKFYKDILQEVLKLRIIVGVGPGPYNADIDLPSVDGETIILLQGSATSINARLQASQLFGHKHRVLRQGVYPASLSVVGAPLVGYVGATRPFPTSGTEKAAYLDVSNAGVVKGWYVTAEGEVF